MAESKQLNGVSLGAYCAAFIEADSRRIEQGIRTGLMSGENAQEIGRRILGSADKNGVDGITQLTRADLKKLAGLSLKRRTYAP